MRVRILLVAFLVSAGFASQAVPNYSKRKGAGPLFRIVRNRATGYMDRTGKIMIPPRFDNARDFFQGLAAVQRKRKWSYINGEGDVAISGPFDDVGDFFEGLAPIRVGREWSYINTAGEMAIKPQFQAAAEFREGLARVYIWSSTRCEEKFYTTEKVPNPDGEFRLPEKIIPGDTWCSVQDGKFGDVDRNGNFVVTPRYVRAMDFSEGLAAILFT